MLTPAENERLTRVGAGTPMGETLRRYWHPACLSEELPEADGAPVRVRLLGQDLIAFRDCSGAVGLVDAFCPHRRAPMFFGRNEEGGLRCVYHGWKFDRDGACVDMPSEPPDSLFKTKVRIASYPCHEAGGIVWTYLGPRDRMGPAASIPPPPDYEFCRAPATHRYATKNLQRCNWLQALEGGLDSGHATIMHAENRGDLRFLADPDKLIPRLEVQRTDYGYWYTGIRTLGDKEWVRVYQYVMPATQMRGAIEGPFKRPQDRPRIDGHIWVPIDDETCWVYSYLYAADPAAPIPMDEIVEVETIAGRGPVHVNPDYSLKANIFNDYFIDRGRQKTKNFTGIEGVNVQDWALQEGMGPICDRTQEHLGTSDRAVIAMRQLLLEACVEVARGNAPRGSRPESYRKVRPSDHLIPLGTDWKDVIPDSVVARF
jgi:phthalate 4,5-dioxygenase oxygenase subunit